MAQYVRIQTQVSFRSFRLCSCYIFILRCLRNKLGSDAGPPLPEQGRTMFRLDVIIVPAKNMPALWLSLYNEFLLRYFVVLP